MKKTHLFILLLLSLPPCFSQGSIEINGIVETVSGELIGTRTFKNYTYAYYLKIEGDSLFYNEFTIITRNPAKRSNLGYRFSLNDIDTVNTIPMVTPMVFNLGKDSLYYLEFWCNSSQGFYAYFHGDDVQNGSGNDKHVSIKFGRLEQLLNVKEILKIKTR